MDWLLQAFWQSQALLTAMPMSLVLRTTSWPP